MSIKEQESLIEKVKKLIAKARSTESEAEAQIFMAKASQLLTKYNLSMVDVEKPESKGISRHGTQLKYGQRGDEGDWESVLLAVLCVHNMCKSIIHPNDKVMTIIGRTDNCITTEYMFEATRDIIRSLSNKRWIEYRNEMLESYPDDTEETLRKSKLLPWDSTWKRSYLKGAVSGLHIKFQEEKEEMIRKEEEKQREEAESIGLETSAIVPFGNKLQKLQDSIEEDIQLFMDEEFEDLGEARRPTRPADEMALAIGMQDGKNLNLNKGLDASDYEVEKDVKRIG